MNKRSKPGFNGGLSSMLNFLLRRNPWAAHSLARFSGQTLRISLKKADTKERNENTEIKNPTWNLDQQIDADGLLTAMETLAIHEGQRTTDVLIEIPQNALPWFLTDRPRFFSAVSISGPAALAETIGTVFRNLHFGLEEIEADLARLTGNSILGEIVAHRMTQTARSVFSIARRQGEALRENVREYLVEETNTLVDQAELASLQQELKTLQNDVDKLELRLKKFSY